MKITGILCIEDGVSLGYPFIEAILSVIPILDEVFINDGGSKDRTLYYLKKLQKLFPKKIFIFRQRSFKSKYFEWIDVCLEKLMKKASGDWILEIQADEIWHEKDLFKIRKIIEKDKKHNSIRQRRLDCSLDKIDSYVYKVVRIFRNIKGVKSSFGGDNFTLSGVNDFPKGCTTHNVPPELKINIPFYHFTKIFPQNTYRFYKKCLNYVATEDVERKKRYKELLSKKKFIKLWKPPLKMKSSFPAIIKGINEHTEYVVREELFDKKWLRKITGIKY